MYRDIYKLNKIANFMQSFGGPVKILIITVIIPAMLYLGHFRMVDAFITDLLQRVTTKDSGDVALIFINEDEYRDGFEGSSPLSRVRLSMVVDTLVNLRAGTIALDIDLSDKTTEEDDKKLSESIMRANRMGIPVVITGKLKLTEDANKKLNGAPYRLEREVITTEGLPLYEDITYGDHWGGKVLYGGVYTNLQDDAKLRDMPAFYMVDKNKGGDPVAVPSFSIAAAAAYMGLSQEDVELALLSRNANIISLLNKKAEGEPLHLVRFNDSSMITPNYIGDYNSFVWGADLSGLLTAYSGAIDAPDTIFKNKLVLVGGSFDKRDYYMTPVGLMTGMEVQANIIQNILSKDLLNSLGSLTLLVWQVILCLIIAGIFYKYSDREKKAKMLSYGVIFIHIFINVAFYYVTKRLGYSIWPGMIASTTLCIGAHMSTRDMSDNIIVLPVGYIVSWFRGKTDATERSES